MDKYDSVLALCHPRSAGAMFSTIPSLHSSWVAWTTRHFDTGLAEV